MRAIAGTGIDRIWRNTPWNGVAKFRIVVGFNPAARSASGGLAGTQVVRDTVAGAALTAGQCGEAAADRGNLSPKIRAFIDYLVECFGPVPPWERTGEGELAIAAGS